MASASSSCRGSGINSEPAGGVGTHGPSLPVGWVNGLFLKHPLIIPATSRDSPQCHWGQGAPQTDLPGALQLWVDSDCLYRTWHQASSHGPAPWQPSAEASVKQLTALPSLASLCLQQPCPLLHARSSHRTPVSPRPDLCLEPSPSRATFNPHSSCSAHVM